MAITIHQSPAAITPVYNDMIWVISSSNVAQTSFKYIVDVWYNGAFRSRFKLPARPDTYCVFNGARVVESLITSDIEQGEYGILQSTNSFENVVLKFGEEYGSTLVEYTNLTVSSVVTAFNASLDVVDYVDWDYTDYNLDGTGKKFLTNSPASQDIHLAESAWLQFYAVTGSNVDRAVIKTYNTSGGLVATTNISNAFAAASGFFRIGMGSTQLNSAAGSTIISASTGSYTIYMATSGGTAKSETKTFVLTDSSCKYDNYRLHWLNKLGGYDSFNFELVSRQRTNIDRKVYRKNLGALSGTTWSYAKMDRQDIVYDSTNKRTVTVTSDWMTDAQALWIEELFTSPEVYYENSSNELIPVTISNTSYEQKKKQNQKLVNYEIDFSFSHVNERQRG